MAEARLIDANALDALEDLKYIYHPVCDGDAWYRAEDVWKCIGEQPTIDPESLRPKGRWEWFEEWLPSTPDHPRECDDCGWRCGKCKRALEDMVGGYWDIPDEKPELNYCPNCGAQMNAAE